MQKLLHRVLCMTKGGLVSGCLLVVSYVDYGNKSVKLEIVLNM